MRRLRRALGSQAGRAIAMAMRVPDRIVLAALAPLNRVMERYFAPTPYPNSVLHVSYMVHIPYHMVRHLRRAGMRADYLAIGRSTHWDLADHVFVPSPHPLLRVLQEFRMFWRVVARYETVHAHFMYTLTREGWELPILKRLGRKLVVHFRGCEARDGERNVALHPDVNICQECDHKPPICGLSQSARRRELARLYADRILVTTPDMLDFNADASHFPFFAPENLPQPHVTRRGEARAFKIVHVTNQPGIEGTRHIERAVARLRDKGFPVRFVWLHDRRHEEVLAELASADLAIGKMKMGYYANAQIESMAMGVPTVTYVRDEFMTDALRDSGFIFASLESLESVLEHYLTNPGELAAKRAKARASILALHDNKALTRRLVDSYGALHGRTGAAGGA
jgi:glycosyltransferase involved in cell wall biosynthesis